MGKLFIIQNSSSVMPNILSHNTHFFFNNFLDKQNIQIQIKFVASTKLKFSMPSKYTPKYLKIKNY